MNKGVEKHLKQCLRLSRDSVHFPQPRPPPSLPQAEGTASPFLGSLLNSFFRMPLATGYGAKASEFFTLCILLGGDRGSVRYK